MLGCVGGGGGGVPRKFSILIPPFFADFQLSLTQTVMG